MRWFCSCWACGCTFWRSSECVGAFGILQQLSNASNSFCTYKFFTIPSFLCSFFLLVICCDIFSFALVIQFQYVSSITTLQVILSRVNWYSFYMIDNMNLNFVLSIRKLGNVFKIFYLGELSLLSSSDRSNTYFSFEF